MTKKTAENNLLQAGRIAIFLLFVFICTYLSSLNETLWFDEAHSLAMARLSWTDILNFAALDYHPPLYFLLLKIFTFFLGTDIFIIRLTSLLPVILTLVCVNSFLLKNFNKYASILFMLAFLASNPVISYAIEIRMYGWALFFVTMTHISAFNAIKTNATKWYIFLFVFFILTFYTQYYAGVTLGIGYIFFAIYTFLRNRRRIKTVLLIAGFSFLLYLPWFLVVIKQVSMAKNDFWIPSFHWTESIKFVLSIFSSGNIYSSALLLLLFVTSLVIFCVKKQKRFEDYFFFAGLISIFCFVVFGTVLSVTVRPLFLSRYLVPSCGIVWLFFATQLSSRPLKPIHLTPFFILLILGGHLFLELRKIPKEESYKHFNQLVLQNIKPNDVIIVADPKVSGVLIGVIAYLFPHHKMAITYDKSLRSENLTINYHITPFDMEIIKYSDLKNYTHRKKWLIMPYNAKDKNPEKFGNKIAHSGNFGWMSLQYGYQFDLYEILPDH